MNWNESENKNKEKVKFKTHESVLYVLTKDFDDWFYKRMILKDDTKAKGSNLWQAFFASFDYY